MNKYIAVVKRWLADADSVTLQELRENRLAASDAAAANAAVAGATAAAIAATAAEVSATVFLEANRDVAHWVKRYEELSK
tara:strand:+ start:387 stop:626 length:240 start_codon:yes stop_codon:yes gene_type:complete